MKIRIIKESSFVAEELLDEAKEDKLYEKYWGGDSFLQRDFRLLLTWIYGKNPTPGISSSSAERMLKRFKRDGKSFAPERQNRIKYLDWATKMHQNNFGIREIVDALDKYHKNIQSFPKDYRNVNVFGAPYEMEEAWYEYVILKRAASRRKSRAGLLDKGVLGSDEQDFIYKDQTVEVVRPYTVHASCQYGKGTEWCIAQKDVDQDTGEIEYNRWFDDYTQNEAKIFYFILDDSRKSNDKYYKVTIQVTIGMDDDEIKVDGYWDLTDNAHLDPNPVPDRIEKLEYNKVYKDGVLDEIMAAIMEHAEANPPVKAEAMKIRQLYDDIYDGKYDEQYVRFTGDLADEDEIGIIPTIEFDFILPMLENYLDRGGDEDTLMEAWNSAVDAGLDEVLEEYFIDLEKMDANSYYNSYNDIRDVIDLGGRQGNKSATVGFGLGLRYFNMYSDAIDHIEDIKNYYYFEKVDNIQSDLIDMIQSSMKRYLNPEGREGIQNLAKKIWALNARFKYFETNYHDEGDEDLAVSYETKEPYVVPLKIPVYNKVVKGYSKNLKLQANVDSFLKVATTILAKRRIKNSFVQAIGEIHQKVIQAAANQMKINFPNVDPPKDHKSTTNRPEVRVDVSMPSVRDIRGEGEAPEIKVKVALVVTDENDPKDILWSSQYVQMLDANWDEIVERFLQLFDIDKRQQRLNIIFRDKVLHKDEDYLRSKGLMPDQIEAAFGPAPVNERKRRIKIKIK